MPDDKPKLAERGFFKKPDYLFAFKNWNSMGGIYAYSDRLEIRKGFLNFNKTEYCIYFKDMVSFAIRFESSFLGVGIWPWMEIEFMDHGNLKNFEFYAGRRGMGLLMIGEWMEKKGVKKKK